MAIPNLGISGLLDAYNEFNQQLEYWRDYYGHEIRIIERNDGPDSAAGRNQTVIYAIEGTIEEVKSFPSGFLLSDVSEVVYNGAADGNYEPALNKEENVIREVNEKFVAFSTINQLEFKNSD